MLLRNKLKLLFFLFIPFQLMAGGSHFEVKIDKITIEGVGFEFTATVLGNFNYDSSDCDVIAVSGEYDAVRWSKYTTLISEEKHVAALKMLENSIVEDSAVNFGYIGAGLHKLGDCKYESKGLFHDAQGIFSIYTRI